MHIAAGIILRTKSQQFLAEFVATFVTDWGPIRLSRPVPIGIGPSSINVALLTTGQNSIKA